MLGVRNIFGDGYYNICLGTLQKTAFVNTEHVCITTTGDHSPLSPPYEGLLQGAGEESQASN